MYEELCVTKALYFFPFLFWTSVWLTILSMPLEPQQPLDGLKFTGSQLDHSFIPVSTVIPPQSLLIQDNAVALKCGRGPD